MLFLWPRICLCLYDFCSMPNKVIVPRNLNISFPSLSLCLDLGGSWRGEDKEWGCLSVLGSKSSAVLVAYFYVSSCFWPDYRSLLRHLHSHRLQPGRCWVVLLPFVSHPHIKFISGSSCDVILYVSSLAGQSERDRSARAVVWVLALHRHHSGELCGSRALRPDSLAGAV